MRTTKLVSLRVAAIAGLAGVIGLSAATCTTPEFVCEAHSDCVNESGDQGVCEENHRCSFWSEDCPSGRRYGALAGAHADACAEEAWWIAIVDAPLTQPAPKGGKRVPHVRMVAGQDRILVAMLADKGERFTFRGVLPSRYPLELPMLTLQDMGVLLVGWDTSLGDPVHAIVEGTDGNTPGLATGTNSDVVLAGISAKVENDEFVVSWNGRKQPLGSTQDLTSVPGIPSANFLLGTDSHLGTQPTFAHSFLDGSIDPVQPAFTTSNDFLTNDGGLPMKWKRAEGSLLTLDALPWSGLSYQGCSLMAKHNDERFYFVCTTPGPDPMDEPTVEQTVDIVHFFLPNDALKASVEVIHQFPLTAGPSAVSGPLDAIEASSKLDDGSNLVVLAGRTDADSGFPGPCKDDAERPEFVGAFVAGYSHEVGTGAMCEVWRRELEVDVMLDRSIHLSAHNGRRLLAVAGSFRDTSNIDNAFVQQRSLDTGELLAGELVTPHNGAVIFNDVAWAAEGAGPVVAGSVSGSESSRGRVRVESLGFEFEATGALVMMVPAAR